MQPIGATRPSTNFRTRIAAALIAAWPIAAQAQPAEEFFRGKKDLNLITSSAVGGGYDSYSRLLAHHMSKYLPGNPTIVVQNMLGGGGIRATNYIYNVAPRDGTVFALIDRGMPTAPLLYADKSQARFDAVRFTWIGSIMRETGMGVLSARTPRSRASMTPRCIRSSSARPGRKPIRRCMRGW